MRKFTQEEFVKIFFIVGGIIFIGIGISNIFTNAIVWKNMLLSAKVSAVLSNIFNFVLAISFFYMFNLNSSKKAPKINEEQIEEALKDIK